MLSKICVSVAAVMITSVNVMAQGGPVWIVGDISNAFHSTTAEATTALQAIQTEVAVYTQAIDVATKDIRGFANDIRSYTNETKENIGMVTSYAAEVGDEMLSVAEPIEAIGDMTTDALESDEVGKASELTKFNVQEEFKNFRSQYDKYKTARAKLKSYAEKFDQYRLMKTNLKAKTLGESQMQVAEAVQAGQAQQEKNHQELMGAMNMQTQALNMEWKQKKAERDMHDETINGDVAGIGAGSLDFKKTAETGGSYYESE